MTKILYTATVVRTHINAFHLPYIAWCKAQGWTVHVAARNDYKEETCVIPGCDQYFDIPFDRSPFSAKNISVYRRLKKIIDSNNYDIIHCNTPVAAVLTRLAAREARKHGTKVIYTAHGFHFFKGAPLKNWLLFHPVEKFLSRFTDVLITINEEDYNAAQSFKAGKIVYIPGVGIDVKSFATAYDRKEIRGKLNLEPDEKLLLSVGELIKRKNHEIVFDAICGMDEKVKYAICGSGELQKHLSEQIEKRGLGGRVMLLGFRRDVARICSAADIFVFPSLQEGLPVALMEAMAAGLPCVASRVRGNEDLIKDGVNGFLCLPGDAAGFTKAISRLCEDAALRDEMGRNNKAKAADYDINRIIPQVTKLYTECAGGE